MDNISFGPDWLWKLLAFLAIVGAIAAVIWSIKGVIWLFNHVQII